MNFDLHLVLVWLLRILLAFAAGCILGLERKSRAQAFGLRTLILICESSTLLGILSMYIPGVQGSGDGGRIAAQVVSGIGFLGGGAIMRQGLNIKGLTSAAIIWTAAAIGLALGAGLYIPAGIALIVAVFSLIVLEKFEEKLFPAGRSKSLHLTFNDEDVDMNEIREAITRNGFLITDFNMSRIFEPHQLLLHFSVKAPKKDNFDELMQDIKKLGTLREFSITD